VIEKAGREHQAVGGGEGEREVALELIEGHQFS
jgi:hypothetical protein